MNGGRKFRFVQQIFWASTVMAVCAVYYFITKGLEPMPPLWWWSSVQAANLTVYGGLNVVQKKISNGADI